MNIKDDKFDFTNLTCQISQNDGTIMENLMREAILLRDLKRSVDVLCNGSQECRLELEALTSKEDVTKRLIALQKLINIFVDIVEKRVKENTTLIRKGLLNSLHIVKELEMSSIDTEILEKLTNVLLKLILSREDIVNWETRSESILKELFQIFKFDAFFSIFESKKDCLDTYLFYMKDLEDIQKKYIKDSIIEDLLTHFQISDIVRAIPIAFIEKHLLHSKTSWADKELILRKHEFLTDTPGIGGILGIAVFVDKKFTSKESDIIDSILSIMTLVIGSSKALYKAIKELEFYAGHDPLTGLYNRRMFEHFLKYEVLRVKRKQYKFSILMQDLDDFKYVNDSYGHPFGDMFLKEVAEEIRSVTREGDVVARLGGDEFALILSETNIEQAKQVAEKIQTAFRMKKIHTPDKKIIPIKASIGLVEYPTHGNSAEEIMLVVDAALYKAKELGKNKIFTPSYEEVKNSLKEQVKEQTMKFNLIQEGIEDERFVPFYQPIYNVRTGKIIAYEALARLVSKDGHLIPAHKFIDLAERIGKIFDIDKILIKKAFLKKKSENMDKLLFINLSGKVLKDKHFGDYLIHIADETGIFPNEIVL
ncbi:diguanylate cyclase/phosphodiesterase, partial [Candidatus Magnetoovum chiemensis]